MIRFRLIIIVLFFSSSVSSQISKGQWMLGGNGSFSHSVVKQNNDFFHSENKITGLQLTPGAGYFFMNQLAAGLRAGVIQSDMKQETNSQVQGSLYYLLKSKITAWSVSPFVRYYFLPSSRKLNVFADASYAYADNKEKTSTYQVFIPGGGLPSISSSTNNSKYKSHSYSIAAGPAFFINPKVSVELTAGYSFTKYGGNTNQKSNTFLLGAGFQIHLSK
ncbi:MAG: outer membrane beta-barrel protein [Chitinophagaceae bacterium]